MAWIDEDTLAEADRFQLTVNNAQVIGNFRRAREQAALAEQPPVEPVTPATRDLGQLVSRLNAGWGGAPAEASAAPSAAAPDAGAPAEEDSGLGSLVRRLTAGWGGDQSGAAARPAGGTPAAMPQSTASGADEDDEAYIRRAAARRGIDPQKAVDVANTEGGANRAGRARPNIQGAPAYSHYQLYIGGPENPGVGDEALAAGIDPRDPAQWRRAVDFALDHAARNGWGAFQGAAAAGIGEWDGIGGQRSDFQTMPDTPANTRGMTVGPIGVAPREAPLQRGDARAQPLGDGPSFVPGRGFEGDVNPRQDLLADPDKWAVCGPLGVMAFGAMTGRPVDYETAKRVAAEAGWTPDGGMAGPASQVAALRALNIPTKMGPVDLETIAREVRNGNPVGLSSPGARGHYFTVQAIDDEGRLDLGNSALALSASGAAKRWWTLDELRAIGAIGNVDTAIYMDNPASPTPSVATGGAIQKAGPEDMPLDDGGPSAGDQKRERLAAQAGDYDPRDADQGPHETTPPTYETVPPGALPTTPGTTPGAPNQLQGVTFTSGGPPPADAQWTDFGQVETRPRPPSPNPGPQVAEQGFPDGLTPIYNRARKVVGWLQGNGPQSSQGTPPARDDWRNDPAQPSDPDSGSHEATSGSVGAQSSDDAPEQATKYSHASTQLNLPPRLASRVQSVARKIADPDLHENGREDEPHVTVKYGLTTENADDVRRIVERHGPIRLKLGKTSVFPSSEAGGDYDVVKVDVDSPELQALNAELSKLPNEDEHPTYSPHVTLAYARPGRGRKYAGSRALAGQEVTIDHLTFSGRDGNQVDIPLAGRQDEGGMSLDAARAAGQGQDVRGDALSLKDVGVADIRAAQRFEQPADEVPGAGGSGDSGGWEDPDQGPHEGGREGFSAPATDQPSPGTSGVMVPGEDDPRVRAYRSQGEAVRQQTEERERVDREAAARRGAREQADRYAAEQPRAINEDAQAKIGALVAEARQLIASAPDDETAERIRDGYSAAIETVARQASTDRAQAAQQEARRQDEMADSANRAGQRYSEGDRLWDAGDRVVGPALRAIQDAYEGVRNAAVAPVTDLAGWDQLSRESAGDYREIYGALEKYGPDAAQWPADVRERVEAAQRRTAQREDQGVPYIAERAPETEAIRAGADVAAGLASAVVMPGYGQAANVLRTGTVAERTAIAGRLAAGVALDPTGAVLQGGLEAPGVVVRGARAGTRLVGDAGRELRAGAARAADLEAGRASEASTTTYGTLGAVPDPSGRRPSLGELRETVGTRLDAARLRLDEARDAVEQAERSGTDDELRQADRAWIEARRDYDVAVGDHEAVRQAQATQDAQLEGAGFGRPVEESDLLTDAYGSSREATSPYVGRPTGDVPRTRDEVPRSPGLNATLGVSPDGDGVGSEALRYGAAAAQGGVFGATTGAALDEEDPMGGAAEGARVGLAAGLGMHGIYRAANRGRGARGLFSTLGVSPGGAREPGRTFALGSTPGSRYELKARVVPLADLITSHKDSLTRNDSFPAALQPRLRDRAASRVQIENIASRLDPDQLLVDSHALDRGPMIVGPDLVVESGNGRTLALRKLAAEDPEGYAAYVDALRARLPEYGLADDALQGIEHPVLVRERVTPLDDAGRAAFASEANQSAAVEMSPIERARQDAGRLSDDAVVRLAVGDGQTIDQALLSPQNRDLVRAYVGALPETERAALLDASGNLNAAGLERLKAALLTRTYPGKAGQRVATAFVESTDTGVRNVEHGVMASLPAMARAEALIATGARDGGLSLADDVAVAVDVYSRLRRAGMSVGDYLAQGALWQRETTPLQDRILGYLHENARSPRRIRDLLDEYARVVEQQASPDQVGMFGDVAPATKGDIIDGIVRGLEPGAGQAEEAGATAARADLGGVRAGGQELEGAGQRSVPASQPGAGAAEGGSGAGAPSLADEVGRIDQARADLTEVRARLNELGGDPNADPVVLRSLDREAQRLQAIVNGQGEAPATRRTSRRAAAKPGAGEADQPLRPYQPTTPASELLPSNGGPEGTLSVEGAPPASQPARPLTPADELLPSNGGPEGSLQVEGAPVPLRSANLPPVSGQMLPAGGTEGSLAIEGAPATVRPANLPAVQDGTLPTGGPAGHLRVQGAPTPLTGANLPPVGPNAAPSGGPGGTLAVQGAPATIQPANLPPVTGQVIPATGRPSGSPPPVSQSGFSYRKVAQAQLQARQQAKKLAPNGQLPLSPIRWLRSFAATTGYSSMIGPATFTVNVFGNLLEPLYAHLSGKELARAALPQRMGGRGAPREYLEMLFGTGRGLMETGGALVDALRARGRYAPPPDSPLLSQQTVNPVGRALALALEYPNRVWTGVPDAIFGTIARSAGEGRRAAQLATDAVRDGQIQPDQWKRAVNTLLGEVKQHRAGSATVFPDLVDDIVAEGERYADHQVFRDELGTVGKAVRKGTGGELPVFGNLVQPFFKTPWNMGLRLSERTPLVGAAMNTQKGFDKAYDQFVGTALFAGVVGLATQGRVTGSGPADVQKRREMEALGWQRRSTLVGDTYVPNRVFGIWAPMLDAAGEAHDAITYAKEGAGAGDVSLDSLRRFGGLLRDQPYLQGVADLVSMTDSQDLSGAVERYAGSLASRMTPFAATARTIDTALDDKERTVEQGADITLLEGIRQRWRLNTGGRANQPAAQDVMGRELENERPHVWAVLPKMRKATREDPVVKAFFDSPDVAISRPRTDMTVSIRGSDGKVAESGSAPLKAGERRDWERIRGEGLSVLLDTLVQSDAWRTASSDARRLKLREKLDQANDRATEQIRRRRSEVEWRQRYEATKGKAS